MHNPLMNLCMIVKGPRVIDLKQSRGESLQFFQWHWQMFTSAAPKHRSVPLLICLPGN